MTWRFVRPWTTGGVTTAVGPRKRAEVGSEARDVGGPSPTAPITETAHMSDSCCTSRLIVHGGARARATATQTSCSDMCVETIVIDRASAKVGRAGSPSRAFSSPRSRRPRPRASRRRDSRLAAGLEQCWASVARIQPGARIAAALVTRSRTSQAAFRMSFASVGHGIYFMPYPTAVQGNGHGIRSRANGKSVNRNGHHTGDAWLRTVFRRTHLG